MRTTRTFILRLLVDSEDPTALRGALHAVGELHERAFASPARLLELLQQMAAAEASPATPQEAVFETQPSTPTFSDKEEPSCDTDTLTS